MQVVIHPNDTGGVAVIYPAPEFASVIEAVAAKDVPQGRPWRIVHISDLPSQETRARWLWTESGPLAVSNAPSPVPQVVSRFQAKEALRQAGLLGQADAIVAASNDPKLQNAWANANEFRRDSPGINSLAPAIGLNSAALDDLFRAAAGIVA